jgi:hypothetical protein
MTLPTPDTDGLVGAGAPFPCSLAGRPYLLDLSRDAGLTERTIPLLRAQADGATSIAEASLNPEDLLRRASESNHLGAGQDYRDRDGSLPFRFRSSEHIDVWTKWQLSLLYNTKSIKTLAVGELEGSIQSVGTDLYAIDNQSTYHSNSDLDGTVTWTTVTGTPAASAGMMATDGFNVWIAYNASGVYATTAGAAAATSLFTGTAAYLWYLKGRLLVTNGGGNLMNPTDFTTPPNALPAALLDLGTDWLWMCAAEGINHIYIGGFRRDSLGGGDHSVIYKTAVKPDGTALDVPTVAATLPDGERIASMVGYLGYVVIGVDLTESSVRGGFRLAEIQGDGNLVLGPLVEAGTVVTYGFEPQSKFVWFTWSNSASQVGLGRMDLSRFTDELTPAYATDLMYDGSTLGHARAITTHQNRRVFYVSNDAIVCEDKANRRTTGDIYFGKTTYGVPDNKVAMFVDVVMTTSTAAEGSVTVYVSVDGGARTSYGTLTASGTVDLSAITGKEIEVSLRLTRGSTVTLTPIVSRVTLRSFIPGVGAAPGHQASGRGRRRGRALLHHPR